MNSFYKKNNLSSGLSFNSEKFKDLFESIKFQDFTKIKSIVDKDEFDCAKIVDLEGNTGFFLIYSSFAFKYLSWTGKIYYDYY